MFAAFMIIITNLLASIVRPPQ